RRRAEDRRPDPFCMGDSHRHPHFFVPFPTHCPRSTVVKLAPRLVCPSAFTVASGGTAQMFEELVKSPRLPPLRVITKRSTGWSGRSLNKAEMPPCFVGPISPSTTMRIAPDLSEA